MRFCPSCGARYPAESRFCPIDGQILEDLPDEATQVANPMIGRTIDGRYRVEDVLGEGGMGIVYLATHVGLGKKMALKVLHGDMARDEVVVARFVQEAQASTAIGHPNIVDISDFGRLEDGTAYFVMEMLEGEALTGRIGRGPMPLEAVLDITEQIASALGAAHARGIVHRDLKPDNVFLTRRGREEVVKILDFGIAKVGGAASKLTKTGMIFGTPHYMSPEQAAGQSVDARADIYALGIIVFEMATGTVPFDGDTFMGILSKHMFEPAPRPSDFLPAAHPLEPLVLRALAKKPEDRYPSMEALAADLRLIRDGGRISAPAPIKAPSGFGEALPAATLPTARGPALALAVIGLLLVVGVAAGVFFAFRTEPERARSVVASDRTPEAVTSSAVTPTSVRLAEPEPSDPAPARAVGAESVAQASVRIESAPPGAAVLIDGAIIGNTPIALPRPAHGTQRVELRARGYQPRFVVLSEATGDQIVASLDPVPAPGTMRPRSTTTAVEAPMVAEPVPPPSPPPVMRPATMISSEVVDPWAR
ncbi:MAG: protein kinase [Myxococcales bacterium]|nr:protein kinase [Myxococcales bacterium]